METVALLDTTAHGCHLANVYDIFFSMGAMKFLVKQPNKFYVLPAKREN